MEQESGKRRRLSERSDGIAIGFHPSPVTRIYGDIRMPSAAAPQSIGSEPSLTRAASLGIQDDSANQLDRGESALSADQAPLERQIPLWGEWLTALAGGSATGYTISAFIHGILFAGLSIVVGPGGSEGSSGIDTQLSISDSREILIGGIEQYENETRLNLERGSTPESAIDRSKEISESDLTETGVEEYLKGLKNEFRIMPLQGLGSRKVEDSQRGDDQSVSVGGFALPGSGKFVTKGSFTAWTIPEDPQPNENYLIIIQVKLPPKYQSLPLNDVTGDVEGTDGYRLRINAYTSKYLHKTKQVVLRIPGAESKIRDTIRVHSQILKESQELLIEF